MIRGIYASASGMQTESRRLDVVANNLANAATTGYKKDTVVHVVFAEVLLSRLDDRLDGDTVLAPAREIGRLPMGAGTHTTATRLVNGTLNHTGRDLDVALAGDGFFAVRTAAGIRYTRDGSFQQDARGRLVTAAGDLVLAGGQPVGSPGARIAIRETGVVEVDGQPSGSLDIRSAADLGPLRKMGANLWAPDGVDAQLVVPPRDPADPRGPYQLRVGFLEAANVEPVLEMVEMIAAMRAYEANQRAIHAQDETLARAATDVGRL